MSFSELGLHSSLLRALEAAGHVTPTPVQSAAILPAISGRDVLATADTGTGKTGAFILPALHHLLLADEAQPGARRPFGPRVLVLAPTRELARQVCSAARVYGKYARLNIVDVVGGMPFAPQARELSRVVDVLVATPGRLIDHLGRRNVSLGEVQTLIIDEADRMLDMGFVDDIQAIAALCPKERQTLLFTATLDRRMEHIARGLLRDDVARVAVDHQPEAAPRIEQCLIVADDLAHKRRMLDHLAGQEEIGKAIIFAATKRDTEVLAAELVELGHAAAALHGDMLQRDRMKTLTQLRDGRVRLLVATDVAARGIDVRDITHVVNFDLPRNPEDYIHRIGRTGRAGAEGVAISFATRADRGALASIERLIGERIAVRAIPGLEAHSRLDPPPARPKRRGPPPRGSRPVKSNAEMKPRRAVKNRDGGWTPMRKQGA